MTDFSSDSGSRGATEHDEALLRDVEALPKDVEALRRNEFVTIPKEEAIAMNTTDTLLVPIGARTRFVALLGDPVEHSLSPVIHNAAFRAQELNYVYAAFRVAKQDVMQAVAGLRALSFAGANVTIPHKQAVIPALDVLSPQARDVGAVNTIIRHEEDGRAVLEGDNTDVTGFLAPLLSHADMLEGARMTILGSGGAARAVAYALLTTFRPEKLTLAVRTTEHGEQLAADLAGFDETSALDVRPIEESSERVKKSRLVVNATPVGMHPQVDRTPWPDAGDFAEEHVVYDMIYNPQETLLLREASKHGAATIGGMDMLIAQAAAAYAQWTGLEMPTDVVREAIRAHRAGAAPL